MAHAAQHQAPAAAPKEDRFVSHIDIAKRLCLNPDHVRDRLTKRKDFPRPFVPVRWRAPLEGRGGGGLDRAKAAGAGRAPPR